MVWCINATKQSVITSFVCTTTIVYEYVCACFAFQKNTQIFIRKHKITYKILENYGAYLCRTAALE